MTSGFEDSPHGSVLTPPGTALMRDGQGLPESQRAQRLVADSAHCAWPALT